MDQEQSQQQKKRGRIPVEVYRPKLKKDNEESTPRLRVNGQPYAEDLPGFERKHGYDARQDVAWEYYLKNLMKGYENAREAGLFAGYSETTSAQLSQQPWFKERKAKLKRREMLSKAERNLDDVLDLSYRVTKTKTVGTGEDAETIETEEVDTDILKVVVDVSKMVTSTLGKDEGYSTKSLVDHDVRGDIQIKAVSYADTAIEAPKEATIIDVTETKEHENTEDVRDIPEESSEEVFEDPSS